MSEDTVSSRYRLQGRVAGTELTIDLAAGEHRLGSSPACDIHLPVRGVSRDHAVLVLGDHGLVVEDRGSKNGTFVNRSRVVRCNVPTGARLDFGPVGFAVEEVDEDDEKLAVVVDSAAARPPRRRRRPFCESAVVEDTESDLAPPCPWTTPAWLELAERFVARLFAIEEGDPGSALGLLNEMLGARGSCLVEWLEGGTALVVATRGAMEEETVEQPERPFVTGPRATLARLDRASRAPLGLAVWGDFAGRSNSEPLLRLLLRLLDRGRGAVAAAPPAAPAPGDAPLIFPAGYRPCVSPAMAALYRQVQVVAPRSHPVLILGDTGVGKEKIAAILHASSGRRDAPWVAINCAAIPPPLLEAELFGIDRRVATGVDPRPGKFRQADGGTLFLDEIGEMLPALQAKMLRVLQERQVQPVGGMPQPVDVRVVAATNADLEARMERGEFRRDLYYRLSGFVLEVPPLRLCREDIPLLVDHFVRVFSRESGIGVRGVTVKALRQLTAWPWPGNVRELENEIRRLVYSCADGEAIDGRKLAERPRARTGRASAAAEELDSVELEPHCRELETRLIRESLRRTGGRQLQAARLLGISRNGLADKIRRYGIDVKTFRP